MAHRVVFAGEYDIANKDGIQRTLQRFEASEGLVIDLTDVTYFDSTFISELIRLERTRKAQNFERTTIVAPAKSVVRRLFEIAGLAPLFTIVESHKDDPDSIVEYAVSCDSLDATADIIQGTQVPLEPAS